MRGAPCALARPGDWRYRWGAMFSWLPRLFGKRPARAARMATILSALAAQAERSDGAARQARAVLESVPRPLWLRDKGEAGKIIWCNAAYASAVGLSAAQVVEQQKPLAPRAATPEGGGGPEERVTIVIGGQRRVMDVLRAPVPALGTTLGMALDASREDEMARAAQRNRAVYHELLENLRSAIGIYDVSQRLDFYNTAFAQLWNLPEQWLNTRPTLGEIMDRLRETRRLPEQADFGRFKDGWLSMFTDLIEPHDDMLHLPDGSAFRVLVIAHPMGGLMMIFEDVTSRLALESSYNTLVAVQRETLDALAEGVAVFGGDGRLRLWNPAFAGLWGLHPEALDAGPHISEIAEKMARRLPFGSRAQGREALHALALDRTEGWGQLLCADLGSEVEIHLAYTSAPLPDGGVMTTFRDVSDAVRAAKALDEKARALEAAEGLKVDFLANVSYQLRTPLNTMMGFADILEQGYFGALTEKQGEYAAGISEAGRELVGLIDDILDLSTIEAGHMELHRREVNLHDLLSGLIHLAEGWAHSDSVTIALNCTPGAESAWCDPKRMRQAVLNLVRNALAYTPSGGRVALSCRAAAGGGAQIVVTDSGPGIAPEDRARIFQPFERAAEPRGGAGLGLTLVRSIMELHGGAVEIGSTPGGGAAATLTLPPRPVGQGADDA